MYNSVPGLLEKRKANKLAKETADDGVNDENVNSNQMKNDNVQSSLRQNDNIDGLCNDFKEMYQASTFSFKQVCKVFYSLYIFIEFNNHKQKN